LTAAYKHGQGSSSGTEMDLGLQWHDRKSQLTAFRSASSRARQPGGRVGFVALLLFAGLLPLGILTSTRAAAGQVSHTPETSSQHVQPPFQVQVQRNMVIVRVIVRDSNGRTVPGLRKESFQLFDNNEPQEIDQFAVESSRGASAAAPQALEKERTGTAASEPAPASSMPHYQALYFDDVEMQHGDIVQARNAADRYLAAKLTAGDKAGIFTSSGKNVLDFTDDRTKLHNTLLKLSPRPSLASEAVSCPDIGAYEAYLILHHDRNALAIASEEEIQCNCRGMAGRAGTADPGCEVEAPHDAEIDAIRVSSLWDRQFMTVVRGLEQVVRRTALLRGQRSVIFVSPGFLSSDMAFQLDQVTQDALRLDVVVNTLDPRGVYVLPIGDVSKPTLVTPDALTTARKQQLILDEMALDEQVLRNLPADTGGRFYHNSNDLDEGFRQVGTLSEVSYILAFSPRNLKFDGRFHPLKVTLLSPARVTIQARRGYFAPSKRS
jgi:VWFA-related protein